MRRPILGVRVGRLHLQSMRTKWGSCNSTTALIQLNTDLARKQPQCLAYMPLSDRSSPSWADCQFATRIGTTEWRVCTDGAGS
ncbi:M48 metallopeptidase family protein [Thermomonas fusca]|uniref:M48 metallopeptidase family protein n=1 Tax=Thermomonas fusca TaxID=215690 RepID=UPI000A03641F